MNCKALSPKIQLQYRVEVTRDRDAGLWWNYTVYDYAAHPRRIIGGGIVRGTAADARHAGEVMIRKMEQQHPMTATA